MKLILLISSLFVSSLAFADGFLQVNGNAGQYQAFRKVKAVRCIEGQRNSCGPAVFFDLNKPKQVPAGSYLLGYENSIHPGFVRVRDGQTTAIKLEIKYAPTSLSGKKVRVYRDFSSPVEQEKILNTVFHMGRHFFRLTKENFGDLYLTSTWDRDFVQRFTYEVCPRLKKMINDGAMVPEVSVDNCRIYEEANSPEGLRELFTFNSDGTFKQKWVTFPGYSMDMSHPRYLVSVPMRQQDHVAVFSGSYKFKGE